MTNYPAAGINHPQLVFVEAYGREVAPTWASQTAGGSSAEYTASINIYGTNLFKLSSRLCPPPSGHRMIEVLIVTSI
jgi:hypothetical protein